MERGVYATNNMSKYTWYKLTTLAIVLVLIGAGCVSKDQAPVQVPGQAPETTYTVPPTPTPEVEKPSDTPVQPAWRELLDMSKATVRVLGSGKTEISLPPLFQEPNRVSIAIPDISYLLREEAFSFFPVSDTPWHTASDISEEKSFLAGGIKIPAIHRGAEKVVRYSNNNLQGYFAFDCLQVEGEPGLSTIFTFFDQTYRYRLELLETRPEWLDLSEDQFNKTCIERISKIQQGALESESKVKYQVLQQMIDSINTTRVSEIRPEFSSSGQSVSTSSWKVYTNNELGISFTYPPTMSVKVEDRKNLPSDDFKYAVRLVDTQASGCRPEYYISFATTPSGKTGHDYGESLKAETPTPVDLRDSQASGFAYWQYSDSSKLIFAQARAVELCLDGGNRSVELANIFKAFLRTLVIKI